MYHNRHDGGLYGKAYSVATRELASRNGRFRQLSTDDLHNYPPWETPFEYISMPESEEESLRSTGGKFDKSELIEQAKEAARRDYYLNKAQSEQIDYRPPYSDALALVIIVYARPLAAAGQFSTQEVSHWAIQIGNTAYEYGLPAPQPEFRVQPASFWEEMYRGGLARRILIDETCLTREEVHASATGIYKSFFEDRYHLFRKNCQGFVRHLLYNIYRREVRLCRVRHHPLGQNIRTGLVIKHGVRCIDLIIESGHEGALEGASSYASPVRAWRYSGERMYIPPPDGPYTSSPKVKLRDWLSEVVRVPEEVPTMETPLHSNCLKRADL